MNQFAKGNNNSQNITIINTNNTVLINGKTYKGPIRIENNRIIFNNTTSTIDDRIINITVNGNVDSIETVTGNVDIAGSVNQAQTVSGDIKTSGNIINANTMSGDITGKDIGSATNMSGNIKIK